ncbi:agmatine deiminase family protein [Niallia sp. 01092]|uniref:agmatine deiminase family protein n=1 Tax=unclassified Niallia TaxID=2837522 RepID=UPI003FD62A6C
MVPKNLHYKMPAEWTEHERTFVAWPVQDSMCFPEDYEQVVKEYYVELVKAIAEFEPVTVVVNPDDVEQVKNYFSEENVELLAIAHNDAWIRDNGPTFLTNEEGHIAGVNWKFNAWGGKYAPWDLDDQVAPSILDHYGVKRFDAPLVMEGGSIHVDGEGTVITTEECLLNPNRNKEMSKSEIEDYLKQYLNIEKVIWLKRGLSGDETDGHVDNIACFAAPGKVLIQVCDDPNDENYVITQENLEILRNTTDAKGRKLEIISIGQPPMAEFDGSRLTLSYLNFYFVNGGIILPVFGGNAEEADQMAEQVLASVYPERKIRKINGMSIIKEGGNVHCTTQQMVKI